jgi:hypothetical protein
MPLQTWLTATIVIIELRTYFDSVCLLQLVNEKPQVIQEYESGKAIPNPQVLSKMSRVLGVTLKKNPTK